MNDELPLKSPGTKHRRRLEERLAHRPELLERLHEMIDTLEQSVADGCDAHDAEDRVVDEIRKLGRTVLGQWAQEANAQIQEGVSTQHPQACKNGKKTGEVVEHSGVDRGGGKTMAVGSAGPGIEAVLCWSWSGAFGEFAADAASDG